MNSELILKLILIICVISMLFGTAGGEGFSSQPVSKEAECVTNNQLFLDVGVEGVFRCGQSLENTNTTFNTITRDHIGTQNIRKPLVSVASIKSNQGQVTPSNPNATVTISPSKFKDTYDSLNHTYQQDILPGGETGDQYRAWFGNDSYEELHSVTFIYSTRSQSVLIFNHSLGDDRTNTTIQLTRPSIDDYLYNSIAEDTPRLNSTMPTEAPPETQTGNSTTMPTGIQESRPDPESMLGPLTTHYSFAVLVIVAGLSIGGAAWHYWVRDQD